MAVVVIPVYSGPVSYRVPLTYKQSDKRKQKKSHWLQSFMKEIGAHTPISRMKECLQWGTCRMKKNIFQMRGEATPLKMVQEIWILRAKKIKETDSWNHLNWNI